MELIVTRLITVRNSRIRATPTRNVSAQHRASTRVRVNPASKEMVLTRVYRKITACRIRARSIQSVKRQVRAVTAVPHVRAMRLRIVNIKRRSKLITVKRPNRRALCLQPVKRQVRAFTNARVNQVMRVTVRLPKTDAHRLICVKLVRATLALTVNRPDRAHIRARVKPDTSDRERKENAMKSIYVLSKTRVTLTPNAPKLDRRVPRVNATPDMLETA